MTALKPIKKAIRNSYFEVHFRCTYLDPVPHYDAERDEIVEAGEEKQSDVLVARTLAPNGAAASRKVREELKELRGPNGGHLPVVAGSVVIEGVEAWEPKQVRRTDSPWQ